MAVTDGDTNLGVVNLNLGRTYERLRKASYRSINVDDETLWTEVPNPWWPTDHEAYVKGVRDALNAVAGKGHA